MQLFISLLGILFALVEIPFLIKYSKLMLIKGYRNSFADIFWQYFIIVIFMLDILVLLMVSISQLIFSINPNSIDMAKASKLDLLLCTDFIFLLQNLLIAVILLIAFIIIVTILPKKETITYGKLTQPKWVVLTYYFFYIIGISTLAAFLINNFTTLFKETTIDYILSGTIGSKMVYLSFLIVPATLDKIKLYKNQKGENDYEGREIDVFFLRSFYLDHLFFSKAHIKNREEFGDSKANSTGLNKLKINFIEFFGPQIRQQLGEMVCIGNPGDRNPKEWITPLFPKMDEWKILLNSLMRKSKIILMQIGESQQIKYELTTIKESGNLHKLCLFTEPTDVYLQQNLKTRYRNWISNSKKLTWEEIRQTIEGCNISIDFNPAAGSVIVFTKEGKAVLLIKDCKLPSEYISAVRNHFGDLQS